MATVSCPQRKRDKPRQELSEGDDDLCEPRRERVPAWVIRTLHVIGVVVTLSEFLGLMSKGLRFLGQFATNPGAVFAVVLACTALIWLPCGYVLLKRQKGTSPWRRRPPAFGARNRTIARVVLVANTAVTLVLIFGVLRYDFVHAQPAGGDQLGVAVAQFGDGIDMRVSARGRELSAFVARNLRREIDLLPGLAGHVTVIAGPLVRAKAEAERFARANNVALVIWGWVSGDDTFVPSFTFVEPLHTEVGLKEIPGWYEVEISGGGTLELSQTVARRTSGLIEYIIGLIYLNRGDYDRAAADFQRAVALTEDAQDRRATSHEVRAVNRTLAIYHLALGRAFAAQGEPDQARAEYEIAQECDAEYGPTYIGLGNIDYSEGRCEEAQRWYEKAAGLVPRGKEAAAFYAGGNAHFCLEQYEAAAADYALAVERADPDDRSLPLYHLVLGITLCRLNRFAEGAQEIQQAQQLAEPGTGLQEATLTELEDCTSQATSAAPTPTPASTPFPTAMPTPMPTPSPTHFPTTMPIPTSTPFPTPVPSATIPEPIAPAMGREYRNLVTFQWRGSLKPGQAYQVTARHTESGRVVQSGLLTEQSWTADLPAERYGDWRWTVSVMQDDRTLATSPEWMFWLNPFPRPTPFPTPPPAPTPCPMAPTPLPVDACPCAAVSITKSQGRSGAPNLGSATDRKPAL